MYTYFQAVVEDLSIQKSTANKAFANKGATKKLIIDFPSLSNSPTFTLWNTCTNIFSPCCSP